MLSKEQFERALRSVSRDYERFAILGALLAKAARLPRNLTVTGGAAISIRTSEEGVTQDVDIVARRSRVVPVLKAWGFESVDDPDGRRYWVRRDLGLEIDIIDRRDYSGRTAGIESIKTPYGPVRVAAVEDLIVRRLVFWKRGASAKLLDQAVVLFLNHRKSVDFVYLESVVKYERVRDAYHRMRDLADKISPENYTRKRSTKTRPKRSGGHLRHRVNTK